MPLALLAPEDKMRDPFFIDHSTSMIEGHIVDDLSFAIRQHVSPDGVALATMLDAAGLDRRVNIQRAAFGKKLPTLSVLMSGIKAGLGLVH